MLTPVAPRLACVKPVASVHPEPGSNSSLLYLIFLFSYSKIPIRFFPTAVYALFIVLPVELDGDVSFLSLCLVLHSIAIMSMSFVAPGFPRKRVQSYTLFHSPPNFFTTIFHTKLDKMPFFSLNTL